MSTGRNVAIVASASQGIAAALVNVLRGPDSHR
jgi:hypothetical protein